ncbi:MAG: 50S ribosomal protein L32 [Proteobacteria bacterium]|nr:50S ribosomal protein L32 [Pseudomonadota bacterium]NBX86651.1 50S ribosomal protein L32 [Pseudomonadota bacterium]
MAVPKRKTSPSRKGMRQQRHARAVAGAYMENPDTGTLTLRHHASREADGSMWFKGKMIKKAKVKAEPTAEAPAAE